jgi:hypothetical protein
MIVLQLVRGCLSVETFHHYTTWNFMLVGLVLLLGHFAMLDHITGLYLQPLALASTPFVVLATAIMFGLNFGVVQDSFHEYPAVVVHLVNILLHGVPFCFIVIWVVTSLEYYQTRFVSLNWPMHLWLFYPFNAAMTGFIYSSSYFYTFSPQAEYKYSAYISNHTARVTSVLIHTGLCFVAAIGIIYFYRIRS